MAELFQIRELCHICTCFDYYYFKSMVDASGSNVMMRLDHALGGYCVALVAEIERRRPRGSCQAQGEAPGEMLRGEAGRLGRRLRGRLRGRCSGGRCSGETGRLGRRLRREAQEEAQWGGSGGDAQGRLGSWGEGSGGGSGGGSGDDVGAAFQAAAPEKELVAPAPHLAIWGRLTWVAGPPLGPGLVLTVDRIDFRSPLTQASLTNLLFFFFFTF